MKILPIGEVQRTDDDGYVINDSSVELVEGIWQRAVEDAIAELKIRFGDTLKSVFLRGSTARGKAVTDVSDIDFIFVADTSNASDLDLFEANIDLAWTSGYEASFRKQHPGITGCDFGPVSLDKLLDYTKRNGNRVLLTAQGVCVYGDNYIPNFPKLRPGKDMFIHLPGVAIEQAQAIRRIDNGDGERRKATCTWIAKRFLRAAFELCMEREQVFTRDLYPCYQIVVTYYPEIATMVEQAVDLAINPIDDPDVLKTFVDAFGNWIVLEGNRLYSGTIMEIPKV